jgi:uncharacterized protein
MFDEKSVNQLGYYVYALIDPELNTPFYIGKGKGNRVFQHVMCSLKDEAPSDKLEKIREIQQNGMDVRHIIIRHDLKENEAFEIESALIDLLQYLSFDQTNIQGGHYSQLRGLMTSDEIIRRYNAEKLFELSDPAIIININKKYQSTRCANPNEGIYEATKEAWVISKRRLDEIKYVLSEYKGLIVEVFEIENWYPVELPNNKTRYGFNGKVADKSVRDKYINRSVAHKKKRGAANPIRYKL